MYIALSEVILIGTGTEEKPEIHEEVVPLRIRMDTILEYAGTVGMGSSARTHLVTERRDVFVQETPEQIDSMLYFAHNPVA